MPNDDHDRDIIDTADWELAITSMRGRDTGGGTWVGGTIAGHRFEALVFAEHAECPDFELEDSRISKLWVQRIAPDKTTVANFDRGWAHNPANQVANTIVDFLAAGLADLVYDN